MAEVLAYRETDRAVELTILGVALYVSKGNSRHKPSELRGLRVFAAIQSLRECAYQKAKELTDEQWTRVGVVEEVIDRAVQGNMQYYPFGHVEDRAELSERLRYRLEGEAPFLSNVGDKTRNWSRVDPW